MFKHHLPEILVLVFLLLTACNGIVTEHGKAPKEPTIAQSSDSLPMPNTKLADSIPQFAAEENEIQISDSFNDIDPTFVIGTLINRDNARVRSLDGFLKTGAKPISTPKTEIVFDNFIEKSLTITVGWLSFLNADLNDQTKAEVTVTKIGKVTVDNSMIDKAAILKELTKMPPNTRKKHGVVIGYVVYSISASIFKDMGIGASAEGYGAKINGKWYSKFKNASTQQRIVAVWTPLPFLLDMLDDPKPTDLASATKAGLSSKKIQIDTKPLVYSFK